MKDFRINDLGGAKNINGINNKGNEVKQKNTAVVRQNFMVAGLKRFNNNKVNPQVTNTGIQDLNLPEHMKNVLTDIAIAQTGIRADRPLIPDGKNLEIKDQDYIPDGAFKEKQYTEV